MQEVPGAAFPGVGEIRSVKYQLTRLPRPLNPWYQRTSRMPAKPGE